MAERGVFSPRLMHFLEIDVMRVHIEEELRIVKLLSDQSTVTKGSHWQASSTTKHYEGPVLVRALTRTV